MDKRGSLFQDKLNDVIEALENLVLREFDYSNLLKHPFPTKMKDCDVTVTKTVFELLSNLLELLESNQTDDDSFEVNLLIALSKQIVRLFFYFLFFVRF